MNSSVRLNHEIELAKFYMESTIINNRQLYDDLWSPNDELKHDMPRLWGASAAFARHLNQCDYVDPPQQTAIYRSVCFGLSLVNNAVRNNIDVADVANRLVEYIENPPISAVDDLTEYLNQNPRVELFITRYLHQIDTSTLHDTADSDHDFSRPIYAEMSCAAVCMLADEVLNSTDQASTQ